MNKKVLGIVLVIIIVLGGGYFYIQSNSGKEVTKTEAFEITHDLGTVEIAPNPEKIIVFDYGTLDILDSLGVEVSGVAKSNLPEYLSKFADDTYTDIGTLFEPNYETIAKLAPDVIFISGRQREAYEELNKLAPTVYLTIDSSNYMASFAENVRTVATIVNKEKTAEARIETIEKSVETLHKKITDIEPTGLILLTNQGKISAYGPTSRFGIIHNTFGVLPVDENIEESNHGQSVSYEYIANKNPDYIFVVDRNKVVGGDDGESMFDNDLMQNTNAHRYHNIIFLDQEAWYLSSGGIMSTEKMIAEIDAAVQ